MKKMIGMLLLGVAAVTYASTADAQGYHKHGNPSAMYYHQHGHAYGHYNHHGRGYHEYHHHHGHDHMMYR